MRIVESIGAGIIADRVGAAKIMMLVFLLLIISYAILALAVLGQSSLRIIYGNLLVTFILAFAMRGVYFALLECIIGRN